MSTMKKIAILLICVLALFAVNSAFAAQQPQINLHVDNIKVGEIAHLQITLPKDATGVVTVSVDGRDHNATLTGGNVTVDLNGLNEGKHSIKVKYHGEGNYSNATNQTTLEVINSSLTNNNTHKNASGVPVNNTPVNNHTNVTPKNNTNITPKNNTNITPKNNTNITPKNNTPKNNTNIIPVVINNITKITNNTNNTNNTHTKNVTNNTTNHPVVQTTNNHPPKKPPQTKNPGLSYKNTGLPIAIAVIVIIGIVGGVLYRKR